MQDCIGIFTDTTRFYTDLEFRYYLLLYTEKTSLLYCDKKRNIITGIKKSLKTWIFQAFSVMKQHTQLKL